MVTSHAVHFVDQAHVLMSDGWVVRTASLSDTVLTHLRLSLGTASNATTSTSPKKPSSKKRRAIGSSSHFKLGVRRAKQRWSALVSAPSSRLARCMGEHLGEVHWSAFVCHANRRYKAAYVEAFCRRILRCAGPLGGGPCPHTFEVDLMAPDASNKLSCLHLDHEHPVHLTCAQWSAQLADAPQSWDDGVDGGALCHALFGVGESVHGEACVRFRCGPRRDPSGRRMCFAHHSYCHTS
jgi:hypothetical protein